MTILTLLKPNHFHQVFPTRNIPVDPYYLVKKAKEVGYHPQVILAGRSINDSMPRYVATMAIKGLNKVGKTIKDSNVLIMGLTYKEDVADTRESPVENMVHELKEFDVNVFGYDPLLSSQEIEHFGARLCRNYCRKPCFYYNRGFLKLLFVTTGANTTRRTAGCFEVVLTQPILNRPIPASFEATIGHNCCVQHYIDKTMDAVIIAVAHKQFRDMKIENIRSLMNDHPVLIDVRGMVDSSMAQKAGMYYRKL